MNSGKSTTVNLGFGCHQTTTVMCHYTSPDFLPQYQIPHSPTSMCTNPDFISTETSAITCDPNPTNTVYVGTGPTTPPTSSNMGASGGGNNNINITVVPPCRFNCVEDILEQETLTPCQELLNLFKNKVVTNPGTPQEQTIDNPDLEDEINGLKPKVESLKDEFGYLLDFKNTIGADDNEIKKYNATYKEGTESLQIAWQYKDHGFSYGIIHTHPIEGVAIPSFRDLNTLVNLYDQAKHYNKTKVVMMVIAKDPDGDGVAVYAVKIDDYETLKQQVKSKLRCGETECTGKELKKKIEDIDDDESEYYGLAESTYEKKFLQNTHQQAFLYTAQTTN